MKQICIYTEDTDLAESFRLFFEGKYHIELIRTTSEAEQYLNDPACECRAFIYDAINPSDEDLEFIKRMKSKFPALNIMVCYVYFEEKHISETLLASQVDAIIYKPFDLGEVDRQLQKLFTKPPINAPTVNQTPISTHNSV